MVAFESALASGGGGGGGGGGGEAGGESRRCRSAHASELGSASICLNASSPAIETIVVAVSMVTLTKPNRRSRSSTPTPMGSSSRWVASTRSVASSPSARAARQSAPPMAREAHEGLNKGAPVMPWMNVCNRHG